MSIGSDFPHFYLSGKPALPDFGRRPPVSVTLGQILPVANPRGDCFLRFLKGIGAEVTANPPASPQADEGWRGTVSLKSVSAALFGKGVRPRCKKVGAVATGRWRVAIGDRGA
ncbi:hypothetical protein PhaeoP75_02213 [Phaeobacter gallaeciensis]|uniref:Uncharacterized protein n=1 Tax=Phaeobacter gallaeciensis TaxID=60890 RepID=A0AAD0ED54_9RHOB|nr:hypothetical protein Gal_02172 [Phaeobacter gallaeciensis DSM 26640]ATE93184.1 hypothetical protein PhaeoP11_02163 [Phaeobacter gallaeciensis]ATE96994.1 hypothetical protein PhaeoP73_01683 [Phaeobacter gallaeciensis]ATF01849.1 hypothetical protein PhaeoP75_02213 [Phaeobacter gallaeciensis]ATF06229.1 hypothetical protein PhaeoP63_02162 [Phaeobacter gallaeciensis]